MKMKKLQKEIHKITESYIGQTITPELKSEIEDKLQKFIMDAWLENNTPIITVTISDPDFKLYGHEVFHFNIDIARKKNKVLKTLRKLNKI